MNNGNQRGGQVSFVLHILGGWYVDSLLLLVLVFAHAEDKIVESKHLPEIETESHYKSTERFRLIHTHVSKSL